MHSKGLGRIGWAMLVVGLTTLAVGVTAALAAWAGPNPKSNYAVRRPPAACNRMPSSAKCINAGVYYLDTARAKLHQKPYKLPADFAQLSPEIQGFILANLDRKQYGLPPITGLTSALDGNAAGGLRGDRDPSPSDSSIQQYTSNFAVGNPNIVFAYEAWMYDDGYGSGNLDCTSRTAPGCWGHRHDVLWKFVNTGGAYAMGVAAGKDTHHFPAFAMLLVRGAAGYHPTYSYTWSKAVADGAGKHNYVVHKP